jgi:hypothetical protein
VDARGARADREGMHIVRTVLVILVWLRVISAAVPAYNSGDVAGALGTVTGGVVLTVLIELGYRWLRSRRAPSR